MTPNVGAIDRIVRIVAGLILIGPAASGTIGWWGWLGAVPVATGIVGWCPPRDARLPDPLGVELRLKLATRAARGSGRLGLAQQLHQCAQAGHVRTPAQSEPCRARGEMIERWRHASRVARLTGGSSPETVSPMASCSGTPC